MTTQPTSTAPVPVRSLEPTGAEVPSTVPTHWYNLAADLPEPVVPGSATPSRTSCSGARAAGRTSRD